MLPDDLKNWTASPDGFNLLSPRQALFLLWLCVAAAIILDRLQA